MINWHSRYLQQAAWTRPLREYLFDHCGLDGARRILEVGCGTGAILAEFDKRSFAVHGIDNNLPRLDEARLHAPRAQVLCGDGLALPYADQAFDMTYCHFLLLWVKDPLHALREMRRVTRPGGYVLALAEPDYPNRVDRPQALVPMGRLQTESLRRQGADPSLGLHLADLFRQAGIEIIETGPLQAQNTPGDGEMEWAVLESDLTGLATDEELKRWKSIDRRARAQGYRVLFIPTYFAFGRVA